MDTKICTLYVLAVIYFATSTEGTISLNLTFHTITGKPRLSDPLNFICKADNAEKITTNKVVFRRFRKKVEIIAKCSFNCIATRQKNGTVTYVYRHNKEMLHYKLKWYFLTLNKVTEDDFTKWECAYLEPKVTSNILDLPIKLYESTAKSASVHLSASVATVLYYIIIMRIL